MTVNRNFNVPFDDKGDMLYIVPTWYHGVDWKPNTRFFASLKFVGWVSTRSSASFKLEALDGPFKGQHLYMSVMQFAKVLPTQTINHGVIEGDWTFYKRGSAFSLGPA